MYRISFASIFFIRSIYFSCWSIRNVFCSRLKPNVCIQIYLVYFKISSTWKPSQAIPTQNSFQLLISFEMIIWYNVPFIYYFHSHKDTWNKTMYIWMLTIRQKFFFCCMCVCVVSSENLFFFIRARTHTLWLPHLSHIPIMISTICHACAIVHIKHVMVCMLFSDFGFQLWARCGMA